MESVSVKHEDGTIDSTQRAPGVALEPLRLEQLYWEAIRRVTLGSARFSGDAVRLLGLWPVFLRFGPLVHGRRAILGRLIASRPGGTISWRADGVHAAIEVEGFARCWGALWRLEVALHDLVAARFLALVPASTLMRVVVVGATGTIGRPLVAVLWLSTMSSVWRGSPATVEEGVEWIAADATDTAAMRRPRSAAESSTTSSTRSGAATSRRSTALPRPRSWQVPRRAHGRLSTSGDSAKARLSSRRTCAAGLRRGDPERWDPVPVTTFAPQ